MLLYCNSAICKSGKHMQQGECNMQSRYRVMSHIKQGYSTYKAGIANIQTFNNNRNNDCNVTCKWRTGKLSS